MIDPLLFSLTLLAALGCGLVAGVFFAFSSFIMKALSRLPAPQGIAAMQSINIVVITPLFMLVLFGTGAVCVLLAVFSVSKWQQPGAASAFAGSLIYFVGTVLVTIVFHVPRNNRLASVHPESADGRRLWSEYLRSWTLGNHVRTVAALTAAAFLTIALC